MSICIAGSPAPIPSPAKKSMTRICRRLATTTRTPEPFALSRKLDIFLHDAGCRRHAEAPERFCIFERVLNGRLERSRAAEKIAAVSGGGGSGRGGHAGRYRRRLHRDRRAKRRGLGLSALVAAIGADPRALHRAGADRALGRGDGAGPNPV